MIDKVKISKKIMLDKSKFSKKFKLYKKDDLVNKETGEIYSIDCYKAKLNNSISVIYSNITNKLTIEGRLININYISNRIYNFDDYIMPRITDEGESPYNLVRIEHSNDYLMENSYYDINDKLCFPDKVEYKMIPNPYYDVLVEHGIDEIIKKVNLELNMLLGSREEKIIDAENEGYEYQYYSYVDKLDILDFKVEQLEVSFNVWLKSMLVEEYVELFNLIFLDKNMKKYKNFTIEKEKELHSSFYVKSKHTYDKNINTSYTVNFYNKLDQLVNGLEKNTNLVITEDEKERAKGLLRLEVQLYHYEIKRITGVAKNNKFGNFIDLELLLKILIRKYEYFIGGSELDFYSYSKAKEVINKTEILSKKEKDNLLNHIRERYQYNKKHSKTTRNKYKKMLKKIGIHDYFIPTKWNVEYMESPIKLLKQKLDYYLEMDLKMKEGYTKILDWGNNGVTRIQEMPKYDMTIPDEEYYSE